MYYHYGNNSNTEHNMPDVLYPWLADASWLKVGAGGLLASNSFCWLLLMWFQWD